MGKQNRNQRQGSTRILFDARKDKATAVISTAFGVAVKAGVPLFALTWNAYADLRDELGGFEAATEWIVQQAIQHDRPIITEISPGRLRGENAETATVGPPTWTQERLEGFIAGFREEIADMFGDISTMRRMPPVR